MGDVPSRFVHGLSATDRKQLQRLRRQRELATRVEAVLLSAQRSAIPEIMRPGRSRDSGSIS